MAKVKEVTITPKLDRVLVLRDDAVRETKGGILLPEATSSKKKMNRGTVLAIGPGEKKKDGGWLPIDIKVGDKVVFAEYAGLDVEVDDRKLVLLSEAEIYGTIELPPGAVAGGVV